MNTFHIPTWGWQIYISKKKRCVFQNYETQYMEPPQNGVNPLSSTLKEHYKEFKTLWICQPQNETKQQRQIESIAFPWT